MDTPFTLRPATPADVSAAAPLLYSTGVDAFRYVFGAGDDARARAFVARAFTSPRGPLSHRHAVVALTDCGPCGIVLGFPASRKPAIERSFMGLLAAAYRPWEWPAFLRRALQADRLLTGIPRDSWYLNQIAVDEAHRGQGIARQLLDDTIGRTRAAGLPQVMLHVAMANTGARAFYVRAGFNVLAEIRDLEVERTTGLGGEVAMTLHVSPRA
jgi:ribosomal protein S18 acetylase RimI-like enzyme